MTAVKWTGFLGSSYNTFPSAPHPNPVPYYSHSYLGESLNLSTVARRTLAGQESKVTVARGFVLVENLKEIQFFCLEFEPILSYLTVTRGVMSDLQYFVQYSSIRTSS